MSKNAKKWFVKIIGAESWASKNGAPNVYTDCIKIEELDKARDYVQKEIGKIINDECNKIEWINWGTEHAEIKFNYQNAGAGTIHRTTMLYIVQVDENGYCQSVTIGRHGEGSD